ncbi:UNVERIFIED_CONTAM: protein MULTIPLE CHLOROPLAST DIVISION SITE 1 [Sesamum angustifolium]|uniref:Protein MULTIPLE CHLOROPLAST DIVISION SITE 1 n=1 Tax=Sesamum angustifolium TaxID=2727405 RepID=A0AAW2LVH2_9LAMI
MSKSENQYWAASRNGPHTEKISREYIFAIPNPTSSGSILPQLLPFCQNDFAFFVSSITGRIKMTSIWTAHVHAASLLPVRSFSDELQFRSVLGMGCKFAKWNRRVVCRKFVVKAIGSDDDRRLQNDAVVMEKLEKDNAEKSQHHVVVKLQESIASLPVFVFSIGKLSGMNFAIGLCIVATMLVVVVRGYASRRSSNSRAGSVADLVRRGSLDQIEEACMVLTLIHLILDSKDCWQNSTPLKYEDPFNNPMVKVSKSNSTVEMCGKVYRLAPVTLTDEIQSIHQKRRSRAYQWKRPTIFLKEGEPIPPDVDPDTIRWIPANHPFATTSSDIDEDLAQNNVYQKHGVPFRIQAEHEALQKKLEALQNDQKLSKLVIDPAAARDFERPLKLHKSDNQVENTTSNPKLGSNPPSDHINNPFGTKPPSDEMQNP